MKAKAIFCLLFFGFFVGGVNASERAPVTISPGSDDGVAIIAQSCPTFSWTATDWAEAYRVSVFEAVGDEVLPYEEMQALSSPVISKEIRGPALSWTPSSDERLVVGREYVWYVKAIDVYGQGMWSEGRMFKVDMRLGFDGVETDVRERLRRQGVSEEVIDEVLEDVKSGVKDMIAYGVDIKDSSDSTQDKMRIQDLEGEEINNTFFGLGAGASLTTEALYNSFFGYGAGNANILGDSNTFMGWSAGLNTTTSNNTFIGYRAGYTNISGLSNVFLGFDAGYSNNSGDYNTFLGHSAGYNNTTGYDNTFIGYRTGKDNTEGYRNAFFGVYAGFSNQTGYNNTFLGYQAGYQNTTGYDNTFLGYNAGFNSNGNLNTFIGRSAGYSNTSGYRNTFVGYMAGYKNTTSTYNTFIGYYAGLNNTIGNSNTFLGNYAGYSNTTAYYNTFIGHNAGYYNTTGHSNTFNGYQSGYYNSSGHSNVFSGNYTGYYNTTGQGNSFLGTHAGYKNTTGNYNSFLGYYAGADNTEGSYNTFMGYGAGGNNTTGHSNTYLGRSAGNNNTTGYGNVFLGFSAGYTEAGSNKLYIDNSDASSPLIWGDFSNDIVAINGQLGIGTQSPGYPMELERTGTNASIIVDRTDGAMNYINATSSFANFGSVRSHPLRLVVNSLWTMRLDSDGSLTMKNGATCTTGGEWQNASSRELKENIRDLAVEEAAEALDRLTPVKFNYKADQEDESLGFIAEDVPELVATKDRKGMSAMDVVAVLTKVVQEQQETISELKDRITKLEAR